jgi:hypothetical protein
MVLEHSIINTVARSKYELLIMLNYCVMFTGTKSRGLLQASLLDTRRTDDDSSSTTTDSSQDYIDDKVIKRL